MIGLALIIILLILFMCNVEYTSFAYVIIKYVVIVTGMIMGTLFFRNKINGGYINYGKSLGSGILICLFSSLILAIYLYIYYKFIDTNAIERILSLKETQILQYYKDIPDDKLQEIMDQQRKWTTPLTMGISEIFISTTLGFIFSLIISFFTRKVDKSFEANFR